MLSKPNILVCTDFSTTSDLAIRAANKIKFQTSANLTVLHVIDHPSLDNTYSYESLKFYSSNELKQELMNYTRNSLREQLKFCETEATGEILFGTPYLSIMDRVIQDKIDVVIMGYSRNGHDHFNLGSTSAKVIAACHVPTLIIKNPFEINKIAALIDPQTKEKEIISWAEELAYLFSGQLSLVSLFDDHIGRFLGDNKNKLSEELKSLTHNINDERIKELESEMKSYLSKDINANILIKSNTQSNTAHHLNEILKEENVDTIVMKKHKHSLMEKIFIGSETRRMLDLFQGNLFILP